MALGTAAPAAPDEGIGPLPWRVGGRVGFTVDAAAFPDSTGHALEVYVRVPPATLTQLSPGEHGRGRIRLAVQLRSAFGGAQGERTEEFWVDPADSTAGLGKVVLFRFAARPGVQRLRVRLEDVHSRKRGLAYIGRKVLESAAVEGEVLVHEPRNGRDLSDLEFAWSEGRGGRGGPFWRFERRVLPNPERLYGLFESHLRLFFTARGPAGDPRPWRWAARVTDFRGRVVAEAESSAAGGAWLKAAFTCDLSREPAGGYDVEVRAWQEGDATVLSRNARFGVAWQAESWLRNPRDIEDKVHFLLPPEREEAFVRLHPGEQEKFLDDFWLERDPTPGTAENEARQEFLRRVETANRVYANVGFGPGMFTDMGRVFVRYGEPNEVLHQVIPAGDYTLLQVLRGLSASEDRPIGEVHQKGPGGDMRPFEVWIYEGEIPLPPDSDPGVTRYPGRRRLVFLFVDQYGTGEYALRYSTE